MSALRFMDIPQRIFAALDASLEYDLAGELVCEDRHSFAVTSSFQNNIGSVCFCSNVLHRINTVLKG